MWFHSLLSSQTSRPPVARGRRSSSRPTSRLQVEALEDRTVPAVFNPGDAAQLLADVATSRTNGEEDIINLTAGATYSLTESLVFANNGPTTINGNGATLTRDLASDESFRIITVNSSSMLSVDHVTITNGVAIGSEGGGISVGPSAELTVANSTISGNVTSYSFGSLFGGHGGGIFADDGARVTVANSTISGNIAGGGAGGGGGIFVGSFARVTVANSTISGNIADGGGGILLDGDRPSVTVANSTISGNSAFGDGGGLFVRTSSSTAVIRNSTVAFNTTDVGEGGGISNNGSVTLQSTIVANNVIGLTGSFADIAGSVMAGNCLIEDIFGTTLAFGSVGNVTGQDPLLEPLADTGGPTQTHALLAGSPAIDSGMNPQGLEDDQRGAEFARELGAGVDIGAFEATPPEPPPPPPAGSVGFGATAFSGSEGGGPLTVTLVRSGGSAGSLSVDLTASGGSGDFSGAPMTVTFADGQTTASVPLAIVDDVLIEGPEVFTLSLTGSSVGTSETATLQIADNDSAPPPPPQQQLNQQTNAVVSRTDVTNQVTVARGRLRFDRRTGTTRLWLRLTNNGPGPLTGPISFVLVDLPRHVQLRTRTAMTTLATSRRASYQDLPLGPVKQVMVTAPLPPGAAVTDLGGAGDQFLAGETRPLRLTFANATGARFRFHWRILAGAGVR